jgi:GR25 family glycosyltransferase involved in LPS biosynthesis
MNLNNNNILVDLQNQQIVPTKGYCINLERRIDRWELFKQTKPLEINIKRFDAVDAKNFKKYIIENPLDELELKIGFNCDIINNTSGVIGCFLSHYRLWKLILNDNNIGENELTYIFEDDVNFVEDWFKKLSNYIIGLNFTPNVLYLGGRFFQNFNIPKNILNENFEKITDHIFKFKVLGEPYYFDRTNHAYCISKRGAKLLILRFENYINRKKTQELVPIDTFMSNLHEIFEMLDISPHICWSEINFTTDIQNDQNIYDKTCMF